MFDSIHITQKLDADPNNKFLQLVVRIVRQAATEAGVRVNKYGGTERTLFVAVGGDGTMLEAMRMASSFGGAALGVNLGHLGFLTELSGKHVEYYDTESHMFLQRKLVRIFKGQGVFEERRSLLTWNSPNGREDIVACNEFSLSAADSDTMISYRLNINGVDGGMHRANSVVVATATGSTAYSLSAGGALMFPSLDAFQIVQVAPMTMTARPLIVGGDSIIRVEVESRTQRLRADGLVVWSEKLQHISPHDAVHHIAYTFVGGASVRLIHLEGWNYFQVLSTKLGWNRT